MGERSRIYAGPLALLVLVLGFAAVHAHGRIQAKAATGRTVGQVSAKERAATFTFDPSTAPADRDAFLAAVADARPEAQALIGVVDGLVTVRVGATDPGSVGTTSTVGDRYVVAVNLAAVSRIAGRRGIDRDVLHELGHVVDFALVGPALDARLDAGIPQGYGCDQGYSGSCANPEERFAESFAKWATGDIGVDVNLGYKIPPPTDLAGWGAPLAALVG